MRLQTFLFVILISVNTVSCSLFKAQIIPSTFTTTDVRCYYKANPTELSDVRANYVWAIKENDQRFTLSGYWHPTLSFNKQSPVFYTGHPYSEIMKACEIALTKKQITPVFITPYASTNSKAAAIADIWDNTTELKYNLPFNKMVIFGDSLSDTKNAFLMMSFIVPTSNTGFAGRGTNGRVWHEFIANLVASSNSEGLNHNQISTSVQAFHGAMTHSASLFRHPFIPKSISQNVAVIPGIAEQISSYTNFATTSQSFGYHYRPEQTLFMILFGGNDLMFAEKEPAKLLSDIDESIKTLYATGARMIMLITLPDLSLTPVSTMYFSEEKRKALQERVALYNSLLLQKLPVWQREMSDAKIHIARLDKAFDFINKNKYSLGIMDNQNACIKIETLTKVKVEPVCTASKGLQLYWDPLHPTTTTHGIAALLLAPEFQQTFQTSKK